MNEKHSGRHSSEQPAAVASAASRLQVSKFAAASPTAVICAIAMRPGTRGTTVADGWAVAAALLSPAAANDAIARRDIFRSLQLMGVTGCFANRTKAFALAGASQQRCSRAARRAHLEARPKARLIIERPCKINTAYNITALLQACCVYKARPGNCRAPGFGLSGLGAVSAQLTSNIVAQANLSIQSFVENLLWMLC